MIYNVNYVLSHLLTSVSAGRFSSNDDGEIGAKPQRRGKMKTYASKERALKPHGLPHLRVLRHRKGLSLGQLADMTGIRRDTLTHLETGREDPQPYHLRLLARVLDVPQLELVS
jgi:DNA-binding transcriptional regulator YiaG